MQTYISIRLFAMLDTYTPDTPDKYPILQGTTVRELIEQLGVPASEVKLIFVDGVQGDLASALNGGERVGIFPAVGGG